MATRRRRGHVRLHPARVAGDLGAVGHRDRGDDLPRRTTHDPIHLIGAIAGIFAICDGVLVVQSRLGMLDIFQALFVVATFTALIADRDQVRARMHKVYLEGRIHDSVFGPRLGFRWYRFTAGVMLGLTCGTKWSGIYYIIFFGLLSVASTSPPARPITCSAPGWARCVATSSRRA